MPRGDRGPRGLKHRVKKWIAGSNYTGDPSGSVTPWGSKGISSTPAPGVAPIITLPIDDENDDDGSVSIRSLMHKRAAKGWRTALDSLATRTRTQFMTLANFVAFLMMRIGLMTAFGDGNDGAATLDGSATVPWASKSGSVYTMTRDADLTDLTIGSGVTLKLASSTATFRVYGTGTLTFADGTALLSGTGNAATGSTGGVAVGVGTVGGAPAGASGAIPGGADNGNDGTVSNPGWGGDGGGSSGSVGGVVTAPAANKGRLNTSFGQLMGLIVGANGGSAAVTTVGGGGSGAGGSGDGTHPGGGGGSGGGLCMLSFRRIRMATNTNILAKGGDGASPTPPGGGRGGGGGGGGYVRVVCLELDIADGTTMSAATNCAGGALGTGGSANGDAGATGKLEVVNLGSLIGG